MSRTCIAEVQHQQPLLNEVDRALLPQSCLIAADRTMAGCILTIDGKSYDVSKWANLHPGGPIIHKYHGLDATQVFKAFHSKEAINKLSTFTPIKGYSPPLHDKRSAQILADWDKMITEVHNAGLLKTSAMWYFYKTASTIGLFPLAMFAHAYGWYFVSAVLVGLFWQQLGWLSHEYCHHQVFPTRTAGNKMAIFLGNFLQGFSSSWWKDRHNSHHAVTNILEADPDIDNIPMLAWAPSDLAKTPQWARRTIQYQAYYFLFILPVLRLTWCFQSVLFVRAMKTSQYQTYRDEYVVEAVGLFLHWVWVVYMQLQFPDVLSSLMFFLISQLLAGFGIAIVVFFNHYSCDKYQPELAGNWVCLQLFTTRNMTPGLFTDWICGGLNYQIEHHLFPTMPRHNLTKASVYIKRFCAENRLPYLCCGFYEGLKCVLTFLDDIARLAEKNNNLQ